MLYIYILQYDARYIQRQTNIWIYIYGRIMLRWNFRKWEGVVGTGWGWLRIGTGGGHL